MMFKPFPQVSMIDGLCDLEPRAARLAWPVPTLETFPTFLGGQPALEMSPSDCADVNAPNVSGRSMAFRHDIEKIARPCGRCAVRGRMGGDFEHGHSHGQHGSAIRVSVDRGARQEAPSSSGLSASGAEADLQGRKTPRLTFCSHGGLDAAFGDGVGGGANSPRFVAC